MITIPQPSVKYLTSGDVNLKTDLYKITILGWEKYNAKSKPSMHSVMISKRFFDDSLIATLSSGGKLLYLGLLLRRGEESNTFDRGSGELIETSFIASHDLLVRYAGGSGQVVSRLLDQLQSFQLLKYEKINPFINRIEKNRIEKNRKENNIPSSRTESSETVIEEPSKNLPSVAKQVRNTGVIENFIVDPILQVVLESVKQETQHLWISTYKNEAWISHELKKAQAWIVENPHKAPKRRIGQFFSNWLARGFEQYRKTLASNSSFASMNRVEANNARVAQLFEDQEGEANGLKEVNSIGV